MEQCFDGKAELERRGDETHRLEVVLVAVVPVAQAGGAEQLFEHVGVKLGAAGHFVEAVGNIVTGTRSPPSEHFEPVPVVLAVARHVFRRDTPPGSEADEPDTLQLLCTERVALGNESQLLPVPDGVSGLARELDDVIEGHGPLPSCAGSGISLGRLTGGDPRAYGRCGRQ